MGLPKKFEIAQISDPATRRNFEKIAELFREIGWLGAFKHFEIVFEEAIANYKHTHNLGSVPKDILRTHFVGPGDLIFNHDEFDEATLDITTTGACTVRFFVGTYANG